MARAAAAVGQDDAAGWQREAEAAREELRGAREEHAREVANLMRAFQEADAARRSQGSPQERPQEPVRPEATPLQGQDAVQAARFIEV